MSFPSTGSVLTALKTALEARPGLSGVTIQLVQAESAVERITLLRTGDDQVRRQLEWVSLGALRFEDGYTFPGRIAANRTPREVGSDDSSTIAAAALDRCDTLLAELMSQVKTSPPTVGDQTIHARVSNVTYEVQPSDKGGWDAVCDFLITLVARSS